MAKKETAPILTTEQSAFLEFAGKHAFLKNSYYLTGGTPLTAFYLHHRYSEDLDFFIEKEEVNLLAVQRLIRAARTAFRLKKISYQNYQGLHTFFLTFPSRATLKIDFNYYPFPRIEKGGTQFGIAIDSLHDIAINKLQSIATRTKARDFVDLYFVAREAKFSLHDLMRTARIKFDWHVSLIQFGKQFAKVTALADFPRMIKPLNKEDMENFFMKEMEKLGKDIFE